MFEWIDFRREKAFARAVTGVSCLVAATMAGPDFTAAAQADEKVVHMSAGENGTLKVAKGKPRTVKASSKFYEIVVGDPEVANVTPLTDRSFYVLGNGLGTTAVALFDDNKQLVGSIDIEVTLDTDGLAATIRESVPGSNIRVDSANGRLVLSGTAEDAVAAERASDIAARFSGEEEIINSIKVSSSQQVQLNVRFVEINRDVGQELGTQIEARYATGDGSISFNSSPDAATGNAPAGQVVGSLLDNGFSIDVAIEALEDRGIARRLAEPNLIARSGETASFLAGGEFPIPVSQDEDKISVSYKKFGVGLDFTPTVMSDGLISLDIEPEVSSVDTSSSYRIGDISIPGFIVRRARTSVDLRDGQSFMIAGLLQNENDISTSRVPGLGRLPVLGALFSSKSYQKRETDLVILITPHLVKPIDPSKKPAAPTDDKLAPSNADYFLGNVEEVDASRGGNARRTVDGGDPASMATRVGHFLDLEDR